jgi:AcrR family transcriptional regulator
MSSSGPDPDASPASRPRQKRLAAADRRREREARIIDATRELFDARGVRDAQVEDVARAVGVNRAIIYRHFTGKEELFALTLVDYLRDFEARAKAVDDESLPAAARLRRLTEVFVDFGLAYPAFIDCGVTILRMGPAILDELSSGALYRLGKGMTECLARVVDIIRAGTASGEFQVEDPDLVANMLYSLGLGGLQLARLGVMVKEGSPGVPVVTDIDVAAVKEHLVASSLALVRAR